MCFIASGRIRFLVPSRTCGAESRRMWHMRGESTGGSVGDGLVGLDVRISTMAVMSYDSTTIDEIRVLRTEVRNIGVRVDVAAVAQLAR